MEIVLASASPRRRELMARVTPEFRVFAVDVDETSVQEADPVRFAVEAAVLKARAAANVFPDAIVVAADTVVALGKRILGKPAGRESARAMLELLSGERHRVITGVAMLHMKEERLLTGYELTWVTFRPLAPEAIERYLDQGDYADKAGAYAVQDVGDTFVCNMKGDYDNVVGFPVKTVAEMLARFREPAFTITVEDVEISGGDGVAERHGRKVMVPGAVAGDTAQVQAVGRRGSALLAEIIRIERPSPARTEPGCRHFGCCGGCLFQNMSYAGQLELKTRHLVKTLDGSGVPWPGEKSLRPMVPSPSLYGYRNKMEFGFGEEAHELVLGLRERSLRSRRARARTVALVECPLLGPVVESVFPAVLEFARSRGLNADEGVPGRGGLRHIVLREGKRTGQVMVIGVTSPGLKIDFGPLAESLAVKVPGLAGFLHVLTSRRADVVDFEEVRLVAGVPSIEEKLAGLTFRISPRTFFQTNTEAAELLYEAIAELSGLTSHGRVLGLYSGSGAIEIFLASKAARVTGIDSSEANIAAARENALTNGISNVSFLAGTVEKLLRNPPAEPADILIVDPPRPGLSPKALRNVAALGVPTLVYVSCNPAALARDLRELAARGYAIETIAPFDFFPHTPHLETLAVLHK